MYPAVILGVLVLGVLAYKSARKDAEMHPFEPTSSKIYYFADGDECVDSCESRDLPYKWCYTVSNSWRECSESGENSVGAKCADGGCNANDRCYDKPDEKCCLTRPRRALYTTIYDRRCLSECRMHQGTAYNWCRYWKAEGLSWDKCSAIEGHTVTNLKCKGPCTYRRPIFSANKYTCERDDGIEEECSPVESRQSCVVRSKDRTTLVGMDNVSNGIASGPICFVTTDDRNRRKRSRQSIPSLCANARDTLMCGDDHSLQNMQRARDVLIDAFVRPTPGIGDLAEFRPNDDANPITRVLRREIRAGVYRTEYLEAVIQSGHTGGPRASFRGRSTSTNYFRNQLNALPDDDRGHLVPDWLGGVPADYNLVPQNRLVNRPGGGDLQTLWSVMEQRMREFFQPGGPGTNGRGHIEYYAMMDYPSDETGRPSAFWVVVNFVFPNAPHNTYFHLIEIYAVNNIIIRRGGN